MATAGFLAGFLLGLLALAEAEAAALLWVTRRLRRRQEGAAAATAPPGDQELPGEQPFPYEKKIERRLLLLATDTMDTDEFFNPGCDCRDCEEWRHDHGRTKQFLLFASDDKDFLDVCRRLFLCAHVRCCFFEVSFAISFLLTRGHGRWGRNY